MDGIISKMKIRAGELAALFQELKAHEDFPEADDDDELYVSFDTVGDTIDGLISELNDTTELMGESESDAADGELML